MSTRGLLQRWWYQLTREDEELGSISVLIAFLEQMFREAGWGNSGPFVFPSQEPLGHSHRAQSMWEAFTF